MSLSKSFYQSPAPTTQKKAGHFGQITKTLPDTATPSICGIPDPESEKTFLDSKLNWDALRNNNHQYLWRLYKDTVSLRRSVIFNRRLSGVWYNDEYQWITLEHACKKQSHFGIIVSFLSREQNIVIKGTLADIGK